MTDAPKPPVIAGRANAETMAVRRKAFAMAYVLCRRKGGEAAIMAGFPVVGASQRAYELLKDPEVVSMVQEFADRTAAEIGITVARTLVEAKRNAFNDPRKFFRPDGTLKAPVEWDDDMAGAVASIEVNAKYAGKGEERRVIGTRARIKFNSKIAALEMLMKHQGLFERDNAQRSENLALQVVLVQAPARPEPTS